jgi:preprotein translocase subunit SecD
MRKLFVVLLALAGCPERAQPERGLQLIYKKPDGSRDLRAVVDRRLAYLKLKAHLAEDDARLTVRLPNGGDVERIKALLALSGELQFCEEDASASKALCDGAWPQSIEVDRAGESSCALASTKREMLRDAVGDAGVTLVFEKVDARITGYAQKSGGCVTPHIVGVEERSDPLPSLMLDFDKASAAEFNALTGRCIKRRLLIMLDGDVQSAPVVQEALTGRSAMLVLGPRAKNGDLLAAALAGGALPKLELEKEGRYGPPSLNGK